MISVKPSDLIIGHQTHAGETGKNNEDRATILAYKSLAGESGEVTLAVIADGIGGHRAGEVASQIAVDTVTALFNQTDSRSYLDLFTRAFASIQQAIALHVSTHPESEGMGTTCSAVVIANHRLYTAFIGDSRIYLLRNNGIRQISVDHTWVQEAIEHGILTREEARKHPNRHVVRRHLGATGEATPDFRIQLQDADSPEDARRNQGLQLKTGDIVLMSSDGLTDLVEDHEILAAFETRTPQEAVDSLVLLARQRGGFDNITVTALKMPEIAQPIAAVGPTARRMAPALLGTLMVAAIVGAIALSLILLAYFVMAGNASQLTPTPTATAPNPTITPISNFTATLEPTTAMPATPTALPPTATRTPRPTPTTDFTLTASWLTITAEAPALTALAPTATTSP